MPDKNHYALILAGGIGSRFWPESTPEVPKQFLNLTDDNNSLLQQTYTRIATVVLPSNIYILTAEKYKSQILLQLPSITPEQIICEPVQRNTAPCNLVGALKIQALNPDAKILVAPSDHLIRDIDAFAKDLRWAFEEADENRLITFGIPPTHPATGYGYIAAQENTQFSPVASFTEKPSKQVAEEYLEAGNYFWNAGIFVWSVTAIIKAFDVFEPKMKALLNANPSVWNTDDETPFLSEQFPQCQDISIDYAILERSKTVQVITASFDWNDLGSWSALYQETDKDISGNAVIGGQLVTEDSFGNLVKTSQGKKVLLVGLEDYVIVENQSVLMVVPKTQDQDIKRLAALMQNNNPKD